MRESQIFLTVTRILEMCVKFLKGLGSLLCYSFEKEREKERESKKLKEMRPYIIDPKQIFPTEQEENDCTEYVSAT